MIDADDIRARFRDRGFIVDEGFATAFEIMLALGKPLTYDVMSMPGVQQPHCSPC